MQVIVFFLNLLSVQEPSSTALQRGSLRQGMEADLAEQRRSDEPQKPLISSSLPAVASWDSDSDSDGLHAVCSLSFECKSLFFESVIQEPSSTTLQRGRQLMEADLAEQRLHDEHQKNQLLDFDLEFSRVRVGTPSLGHTSPSSQLQTIVPVTPKLEEFKGDGSDQVHPSLGHTSVPPSSQLQTIVPVTPKLEEFKGDRDGSDPRENLKKFRCTACPRGDYMVIVIYTHIFYLVCSFLQGIL